MDLLLWLRGLNSFNSMKMLRTGLIFGVLNKYEMVIIISTSNALTVVTSEKND